MTATVRRILIYPIKSLDPVSVSEAKVLAGGSLRHDREYAIVDDSGRWINAKREPRIHQIRAAYDLAGWRVTLRAGPTGPPAAFHLDEDRARLETWLSDFFGVGARLEHNTVTGFPDDTESPGPTVVSRATFDAVGAWFGMTSDEASRRFRANVEVDAEAPFWEDRLLGQSGEPQAFQIGAVAFRGVNPCARCAVPARHPDTGVAQEQFQREFAARREAALPSWAPTALFNHYYRLSVNTRIPASEAGKSLCVGDSVSLR